MGPQLLSATQILERQGSAIVTNHHMGTAESTADDQSVMFQRDFPLWWSDWGNRVVAGLGVYTLVYLCWLMAGWGSEQLYIYIVELGFIPLSAIGIVFVIRAIRHLDGDRQSQKAWAFIGGGLLAFGIADGIWAWYVLEGSSAPFPSIADVFYVLSMILLLLGVIRFPTKPLAWNEYLRYWLDGSIILISGAALIGYLVVGRDLLTGQSLTLESLLLLGYPAMDLMLLIAVLLMILRRPRPGKIGMLTIIAAGVILVGAGNLWWVYLEARGSYVTDVPSYALWIIGYALLIVSPQRQADVIRRQLPLTYPGETAGRIGLLLPYIAALLAFGVFMIAAVPTLISQFGILVVLFAALAVFVVGRLFLTLRENTQYQVEQVRQEGDRRVQALVEFSSDLISVLGRDFRFQFQSPAVQNLIDSPPESFLSTRLIDWVHEDDRNQVIDAIQGMIITDRHEARFEWRLVTPDGQSIELETIASNELENPGVQGIVLNSRDVRERNLYEQELRHRANHDPLTGLPNRAAFAHVLDLHLQSSSRDTEIAVMFIDLDKFKAVNDTLGHDAGDELLIEVAERIEASIRSQDVPSRFAGDEFTIMLPSVKSPDEAMAIAERLRSLLDQPFTLAGTAVSISTSIGVTCTSISGWTPEDLIGDADTAMYVAKRSGRNRCTLFTTDMAVEPVGADDDD
jgi:diguanylate cyclase (GGDEF)-like protein/PAS domain S-box-containing protein